MYVSNAQNFKDFTESKIWEDIFNELDSWLKDIHESLEDPSDELSDRQHAKLRGNAEAVRRFKLLPFVVQENIEEDARQEDITKEINETEEGE